MQSNIQTCGDITYHGVVYKYNPWNAWCLAQQPLTRAQAGGVNRLNVPRLACGSCAGQEAEAIVWKTRAGDDTSCPAGADFSGGPAEPFDTAEYMHIRNALVKSNAIMAGAYMSYKCGVLKGKEENLFINLSYDEEKLNKLWINYINNYRAEARSNDRFLPSLYFPRVIKEMEKNKLFTILNDMPKGGNLHLHSGSQGDVWWIIKKGIYITETSINKNNKGATCVVALETTSTILDVAALGIESPILEGTIKFVQNTKINDARGQGFMTISEAITKKGSKANFDSWLYNELCPAAKGYLNTSGLPWTTAQAWKAFQNVFVKLGVMSYAPFYYKYILDSFEALVENNCYIQEVRVLMGVEGLGSISDFEGNSWDDANIPAIYDRALHQFQKTYPLFRLNIIASSIRNLDVSLALQDLEIALQARAKYPHLVFGWDLVNEEDPNHTTLYYLKLWTKLDSLKKQYGVKKFNLFFHDGESDWITDTNVFDCVLLDCKRIGHGFNTIFFPKVEQEVKRKGICLEICPISNQVLRYVSDLRIHPGNQYYHNGVPIVIASDDRHKPLATGIVDFCILHKLYCPF